MTDPVPTRVATFQQLERLITVAILGSLPAVATPSATKPGKPKKK